MNGNDIYNQKYKEKINNLIRSNKEMIILNSFANYLGTDISYSSKYNYLLHIVNFLKYVNKLNVGRITFDDYVSYINSMNDKASSYQIVVYSSLKKFSRYLYVSEKCRKDYMQDIPRPKPVESIETKQKREKGYLEKREIKQYLNTVKEGIGSGKAKSFQKTWKDRDILIILLFLNTGMRCSALYKLDIDNIDLENGKIIVIEKRSKIQEYIISDEIREYIINWLKLREHILKGKNESALFISNRKQRMNQAGIARVVEKYAININGKHITPHKLRATYGTQLYAATKDLYFVQSCMGHSNPKTTELYIRGQKDSSRQTASELMSKMTF